MTLLSTITDTVRDAANDVLDSAYDYLPQRDAAPTLDFDTARIAGGLQGRTDETTLYGPIRDEGAPRKPRHLDSSAGLMEADDSIRLLQWGEGMEEIVWHDDGELLLPDIVEGTGVEERVIDEYNSATAADSNDLDAVDMDDIRYVDAAITAPEKLQQWDVGGYETGVVFEPPASDDDTASYELLNYLDIDVPDSATPIDLEHMEDDGDTIHFDRPVYELDLTTAETRLYQGGDEIYSGDLDGAVDYLEDELGWDELPATPATVKVQAAVEGGALDTEELHEQVTDYLLE